ncbi:MAG: hypothetical protein Barrevirus2_11 [Barrevirus sp.]|uniref:Uncharacterized protein n=1 Tax=Barrevirus sp. TaxID=2487763 RepID=A0A3G4ZPN5_9VIRU|nr:MAG: hypothetical protein Barrevirus2_11 [Barrevirus sp.]
MDMSIILFDYSYYEAGVGQQNEFAIVLQNEGMTIVDLFC